MRRLAKIFDREQTGLDKWQLVVFLTAATALIVSIMLSQSYSVPQRIPAYLFPFGGALIVLDFVYAAISVVFTRGNWRQYCAYLLLSTYGLMLFFFIFMPTLTRAKE